VLGRMTRIRRRTSEPGCENGGNAYSVLHAL
jgi:hypothetical protein